jgi:hypothetical protein
MSSVPSQGDSASAHTGDAFPAILYESDGIARVEGSSQEIGSASCSVIKSSSSPPLSSHSHNLSTISKFPGPRHEDSFDDRVPPDNALANFNTSLSLWTGASDWLASTVMTILCRLTSQRSNLLCHLIEIAICKVRRNLFENADRLSLSFSLSAPHCIHVFRLDTGGAAPLYCQTIA